MRELGQAATHPLTSAFASAANMAMPVQDIDIPAGEARHVIATSYRLPVDVDVYTVQPHAHNLAREIEGFATLPDGTVKRLLSIRNWDFNWQGYYQPASPVRLPAGTRVDCEWTFDNSSENSANPSSPPKRVRFGEQTTNEMGALVLDVIGIQDAKKR